jgi:hypothetical protein
VNFSCSTQKNCITSLFRHAADLLDKNHPTAAVQCAFAKQIATDYGNTLEYTKIVI